jgi:hypothetical protein
MPKDPKRNIQSYQIEGGHLNEFEFQKGQGKMAENSELPSSGKRDNPKAMEGMKRVAQAPVDAHRKGEKRKRRVLAPVGNQKRKASSKGPAKKVGRKSVKKGPTPRSTEKRANTGEKRSGQKSANKSAKKRKALAGATKRA